MESNFSMNNSVELTKDQERMRRDLRYYFMNPKEKWLAKGTIPFKLVVILIKIIFITLQLIIFSQYSVNEIKFFEGSKTSFRHLFLENWDSSLETPVYPPSHGPVAIYKIPHFYSSLSYALENYHKLSDEAIGPYGFGKDNVPESRFCFWNYNISEIYTANRTFHYSDAIVHRCIVLFPLTYPNGSRNFNVYDILKNQSVEINFNGLLRAKLNLKLRSIQLKSFELNKIPNCYQFDVMIEYDNPNHNGQLLVHLDMTYQRLECNGTFDSKPKRSSQLISLVLDIFCFIFCLISFMMCLRSSVRQYQFWQRVKSFFEKELGLNVKDKWIHFKKYSYFLILVSDTCTIIGSGLKLQFYSFELHSDYRRNARDLITCSYFLGLGLFLSYCTLLRYFSYFRKSSVLMKTLSYSIKPLLRFSFCSCILYLAFSLFGWIILGPYHIKFRTFSSTVACLFSLMNGDDMYTTLSIINQDSKFIYAFSQLFIYLFVILFIFGVLNLILTIIIEAYDQVKQGDDALRSQHDLFWGFVNSCPATAKSAEYRDDKLFDRSISSHYKQQMITHIRNVLCCCNSGGSYTRELLSDNNDDAAADTTTAAATADGVDGAPTFPPTERRSDSNARQNNLIDIASGDSTSDSMPHYYRTRNHSDMMHFIQTHQNHRWPCYFGTFDQSSRSMRHKIRNYRRRYSKQMHSNSVAIGAFTNRHNPLPTYLTHCHENDDMYVTHTHSHTHRFQNGVGKFNTEEHAHNNTSLLSGRYHTLAYNRYSGGNGQQNYGVAPLMQPSNYSNSHCYLERDNDDFSSSGSSVIIKESRRDRFSKNNDELDHRVRSL